jgi:hypothetical protein
MDRDGKIVAEDCQDVAALDSIIQAGARKSSGKFRKSLGDPRKLTTSDHVEDGGDELIIRVWCYRLLYIWIQMSIWLSMKLMFLIMFLLVLCLVLSRP